MWDGLASLVEAEGFAVLRVPHEGMIGGANGLTDYTAKTVAVRENMDPAAQVKTLAHELAHVRLHGPDNPKESGHRRISEVEAESVALMVGAAHGMDTPDTRSLTSRVGGHGEGQGPGRSGAVHRREGQEDSRDNPRCPPDGVGAGDPPGLVRETGPAARTEHSSSSTVEAARPARSSAPAARGL